MLADRSELSPLLLPPRLAVRVPRARAQAGPPRPALRHLGERADTRHDVASTGDMGIQSRTAAN